MGESPLNTSFLLPFFWGVGFNKPYFSYASLAEIKRFLGFIITILRFGVGIADKTSPLEVATCVPPARQKFKSDPNGSKHMKLLGGKNIIQKFVQSPQSSAASELPPASRLQQEYFFLYVSVSFFLPIGIFHE